MIQYKISYHKLKSMVEDEKPGWLAKAKIRLDKFKALGHYSESSSIWSEIKPVFMRIQHNKCAYCEKQLETEAFGRIEHDLEHFRPKKEVKEWKLSPTLEQAGVRLTPPQQGTSEAGYHLLAYHLQNYCTSCKTCNSPLKGNYFPIESTRNSNGDNPKQLKSEKPLLVNPVGNIDIDPAKLFRFHGLSPIAKYKSGFKRRRALVCIEFFHLDDPQRKQLLRERAKVIVDIFNFLEWKHISNDPDLVSTYEKLVDIYTKDSAIHASCARSFRELYSNDHNEASDLFHRSFNYLDSISS